MKFPLILLVALFSLPLVAQPHSVREDSAWVDTLTAAVKTDRMRTVRNAGTFRSDLPTIRGIVSPLGEGDPLRWVQTLPGVASGADGTSALYVRGGNMGNNLISLDGVPVYGYSHLLGLTTVIPQDAIDDVTLSKGGFEGRQGNFTSSHLRINSKVPGKGGDKSYASLNTFLVSAGKEHIVNDKISYSISARVSPMAYEYRAFKNKMPDLLNGFDDFKARVGDLYGRVAWEIDSQSQFNAFILGSLDKYKFTDSSKSDQSVGWWNGIVSASYTRRKGETSSSIRFYADRFTSGEDWNKRFHSYRQNISLRSRMTEFCVSAEQIRRIDGPLVLSYGLNLRDAVFDPGHVASVSTKSNAFLSTMWAQVDLKLGEKLWMMAAFRGNLYTRFRAGDTFFTPDAGLSIKWSPDKHFSLEAALDHTSQFYHTLEGLPVGWSIDMIVPSGNGIKPEKSVQAYLGADLQYGRHNLTAGPFYKRMSGLVMNDNAQSLFSGSLVEWEKYTDTGLGFSYGVESLYEYIGKEFQARLSYTWSKSWREGFSSVLAGGRFHARFDRTHVLYAAAFWKGLNVSFTFQSGHWENGAAQEATLHFLGEEWTAKYFTEGGVNDYHMPDIIRLDLGYCLSFEAWGLGHEVNIGVCNVTNHFNPFILYFNGKKEEWEEIALLPILPNFSYRVAF